MPLLRKSSANSTEIIYLDEAGRSLMMIEHKERTLKKIKPKQPSFTSNSRKTNFL